VGKRKTSNQKTYPWYEEKKKDFCQAEKPGLGFQKGRTEKGGGTENAERNHRLRGCEREKGRRGSRRDTNVLHSDEEKRGERELKSLVIAHSA